MQVPSQVLGPERPDRTHCHQEDAMWGYIFEYHRLFWGLVGWDLKDGPAPEFSGVIGFARV
jgi:hypothetical protein